MLPPLHGIQFIENGYLPSKPGAVPFTVSLFINTIPRFEPASKPIWQLIDEGERYRSKIELYCTEIGRILDIQCEGNGQFILSNTGFQVTWSEQGTGPEHYMQTLGTGLYLEQHNIPCIHANAVVKQDTAILLMAPSRTGKSTLSAQMVKHGYQLFTDDMAAMYPMQDNGFNVYPSWSKLRLWPDSAERMFGTELAESDKESAAGVVSYKKVHQRFDKKELQFETNINNQVSKPVKALYYLDRQPNIGAEQHHTIKFERMSASTATMLLLQNSILGDAYRALKLEQTRLETLAQIVKHVPMYRVIYPSGYEHLDNVVESIDCHSQGLDS